MHMMESSKLQELKLIFRKFSKNFWNHFIFGLKVIGIFSALIILIYIVFKIAGFDFLYETNLQLSSSLGIIFVLFIMLVLVFIFMAFLLFNTKHRRNTKYTNKIIGILTDPSEQDKKL